MQAPSPPHRAVPSSWNLLPTPFLLALTSDLKYSPPLSYASPSCFFRGPNTGHSGYSPLSHVTIPACLPSQLGAPGGRNGVDLVRRGIAHTEHVAGHTPKVLNE